MWWQRNLTLEGKIIIFKTLASSKFVFLAQALPILLPLYSKCEGNSYVTPTKWKLNTKLFAIIFNDANAFY